MFNRQTLLLIALALMPNLASAQASWNKDYYQARANQDLSELLAVVEKYHLQQGIDKMSGKFYSSAWGEFNFILNYFPNHPRVLLLMARLCESWRNPKCNMEAYFDRAIRRTPENAGVHLTKGVYLQKQGKLDEAIESYKKSLELNPSSINAHYNLGLVYVAQQQYSLANEHAQQAYKLGQMLPGLRNKLVAAGAWKEIEPKAAAEALQSGGTPPDESGPSPVETEVKAN